MMVVKDRDGELMQISNDIRRRRVLQLHFEESVAAGARAGQWFRREAAEEEAIAKLQRVGDGAKVRWWQVRAALEQFASELVGEIEEAIEAEMFFKDAFARGFVTGVQNEGGQDG